MTDARGKYMDEKYFNLGNQRILNPKSHHRKNKLKESTFIQVKKKKKTGKTQD